MVDVGFLDVSMISKWRDFSSLLTLKSGGSGLNAKPTISAIAQMMSPMTITERNSHMHRLEQNLLLFFPGSLFLRLSTIFALSGGGVQ